MMKPLRWISENEFLVEDVRFICSPGDYSLKSDESRFVLLKDSEILDKYFEVFSKRPIKTVLEFGIFQGGSSALFTLWLELEKFIGVDTSEPVKALDSFSERDDIKGRIKTHYGVSQANSKQIEEIVDREFSGSGIDLIIDDASHHYSLSRKTFEISFPFLKAGGHYVIEDWAWAHWPNHTLYRGETALSKLILELVMLCGARRDLIQDVLIYPWFVVIRKGAGTPPVGDSWIDKATSKRGIELVGQKDLNLHGVLKLAAARLFRAK